MVGERLGEVIAEIPAQAQSIGDDLKELSFGTEPLEEQDQLQLEKHHWVDGGPPNVRVGITNQIAHEAQIKRVLQMAVKVVGGTSSSNETGGSGAKRRAFIPIMSLCSWNTTGQPKEEEDPLISPSLFQRAGGFLRHHEGAQFLPNFTQERLLQNLSYNQDFATCY